MNEMNSPLQNASPPFERINPEGRAPVLLLCDHASAHVPADLNDLGLDSTLLRRHIAVDIGAGDVTRRLAPLLDAPALLCGTSRLVIDCNRHLDDPSSVPEVSDGIVIPGNVNLTAPDRAARESRFFAPYHAAVEASLAGFAARGIRPTLISIHSFTPVMNGFERPWHVGLLWDPEPGPSLAVLRELRRDAGLIVGENEPYPGNDPRGYALSVYGTKRDLPFICFEIRQDLIDTHHTAEDWAHRLAAALAPVLERSGTSPPAGD